MAAASLKPASVSSAACPLGASDDCAVTGVGFFCCSSFPHRRISLRFLASWKGSIWRQFPAAFFRACPPGSLIQFCSLSARPADDTLLASGSVVSCTFTLTFPGRPPRRERLLLSFFNYPLRGWWRTRTSNARWGDGAG